jgi:hypothetical protein
MERKRNARRLPIHPKVCLKSEITLLLPTVDHPQQKFRPLLLHLNDPHRLRPRFDRFEDGEVLPSDGDEGVVVGTTWEGAG